MASERVFLKRMEATYLLGLMDAAQRREPVGVKVACRDRETGEVFEAELGEVMHAQIAIRVGRCGGPLEDGWTMAGVDYENARTQILRRPSAGRGPSDE